MLEESLRCGVCIVDANTFGSVEIGELRRFASDRPDATISTWQEYRLTLQINLLNASSTHHIQPPAPLRRSSSDGGYSLKSSWMISVTLGLVLRAASFSFSTTDRLVRMTTEEMSGDATHAATMWLPMKPVAPVTMTFIQECSYNNELQIGYSCRTCTCPCNLCSGLVRPGDRDRTTNFIHTPTLT